MPAPYRLRTNCCRLPSGRHARHSRGIVANTMCRLRAPVRLFCQDCLAALIIDPRHSCTRCGARLGICCALSVRSRARPRQWRRALDRCLACSVYAHPLPRIIKAYKDAGERRLAPYLGGAALRHRPACPGRSARTLREVCCPVRMRWCLCLATAAAFRRREFDHYGGHCAPILRAVGCSSARCPRQVTGMSTSANSVARSVSERCPRHVRDG